MANSVGSVKPIVTDGLVFCVDALDIDSYSTGSGDLYDLTSNFTGSFKKTSSETDTIPTFLSPGYFQLSGSQTYCDFPDIPALETEAVTLSVWIRYDSTANYDNNSDIFARTGGGASPYKLRMDYQGGASGPTVDICLQIYDSTYRQGPHITPGTDFPDDTWTNITTTYEYDSGASHKAYINGSLFDSNTTGGGVIKTDTNNFFRIGRSGNIPSSDNHFWGGDFSIGHIYNRELSASEVLQNFNAHRHRFGV